jgi:hypothetical protein
LGIKVPDREPWEIKIVQGRETLHGNEEESRQEKETLSHRTLVSELPPRPPERSTSREAFPFSLSLFAWHLSSESHEVMCDSEQRKAAGE